ncbi:MAG: hypothetical protein AAF663_11900 [Planctomycetota bacterium]
MADLRFKPSVVRWYLRIALPVAVVCIPMAAGRTWRQALLVLAGVVIASFLCLIMPIGIVFVGWIGLYTKQVPDETGDNALFTAIGVVGLLLFTGIITFVIA